MDPSTVLLGLVGGLGVYYVYSMATDKNRSTQQHRVVNMGNVQPPPLIRNPIGGNSPNSGYFGNLLYGGGNPYTHEDNL